MLHKGCTQPSMAVPADRCHVAYEPLCSQLTHPHNLSMGLAQSHILSLIQVGQELALHEGFGTSRFFR